MRSPILLLIRMNAAETSASSAIADWTPLTVVPRSLTTAEIETFISDVSTTRTNIASARSRARRGFQAPSALSGMGVTATLAEFSMLVRFGRVALGPSDHSGVGEGWGPRIVGRT